ncbi:suppressor of SWI4 1 homolog [Nerophis lumbriciformis]|uniref:suppressor of SWI4 1 homolog n=1 Tax=Nerophis lumbriciformis TaxID=546530 RepID=UPI002AE09F94|nr:suppressor of SWI4 1 homolog [Nerophis lumbriciformis]
MGRSKSRNQKKSRSEATHLAEETYRSVPHSFVFHRGQVGKNVSQLILDIRRVMKPYTAEQLKVRKKNVLKDFVTVAGPLGVTHFIIFSKSENNLTMRMARLPKGPMLYFKVLKYTLLKDVVSSLKRHRMHEEQFKHHPLLILNNFGSQGMHMKLMATMFQNMFPSINVHTVSLNTIKRAVLLNYNKESQEIEFRHYSLKVVPVGMSRGVKKLMQEKFPNMSKFEDISELMLKGANLSESEAEQDGDHNITELPQVYSGRGNMASQQSAIRLTEIGPRMTLQLIKIQEGMVEGNILYHANISKTEEEIQEILQRKESRMKEKEQRKKMQEQNIVRKKAQKDEHKKKSLAGIKRKCADNQEEEDSEVEDPGAQDDRPAPVESDDEAEYYRQAVGAEPDEDMFPAAKRRIKDGSHGPARKMRKLSAGDKGKGAMPPKKTGKGDWHKDKKNGDRAKKPFGQKGGDREKKPFGQKGGDREKKPFGQKGGDREKKPFGQKGGDREKKPFGKKGGDREKKPFGQKGGDREKKPFGQKGGDRERKPFGQKGGDREKKPFGQKGGDRERKPFGQKGSPGGKPFRKPSDRDNRFGGKKKFEGKRTFGGKVNKDKAFQSSKSHKNSVAFRKKKSGGEAKQGFKHKKGKG